MANEEIWEFDPIWAQIRIEAQHGAIKCPLLASSLYSIILNHKSLERSLAFHLCSKVASTEVTAT